MGRTQHSTLEQWIQVAIQLLAHQGEYGFVTAMSKFYGVSRPTLYAWRDKAAAVLRMLCAPPAETAPCSSVERQVLTLFISHVSTRGIQVAMRELTGTGISLETIQTILHEAGDRAMVWMQTHVPDTTRALALDEIFANNRTGAYLNVVDVHSGAIWASEGPLPVDTDSWTLVLWELAQRGLIWNRVVMDGGKAMHSACGVVTPTIVVQGDVWHELRGAAQVQQRLERSVRLLVERTPAVERQAKRVSAGLAPLGRNPKTDVAAHAQDIALARQIAANTRYLNEELHRLLEVVVVGQDALLTAAQRQEEIDTVLCLLAEVMEAAPAPQQSELHAWHKHLTARLPALLTFVPHLDQVQHDLQAILTPPQQALLGWAWLRRRVLKWTREDILAAIPEAWRAAARIVLMAWEDAVRASSAVEGYHAILRPHIAVHRGLTTRMLALIAVWHNHRVYSRGSHRGKSPLHLSGMLDAPTDWLEALGYLPEGGEMPQATPLACAA